MTRNEIAELVTDVETFVKSESFSAEEVDSLALRIIEFEKILIKTGMDDADFPDVVEEISYALINDKKFFRWLEEKAIEYFDYLRVEAPIAKNQLEWEMYKNAYLLESLSGLKLSSASDHDKLVSRAKEKLEAAEAEELLTWRKEQLKISNKVSPLESLVGLRFYNLWQLQRDIESLMDGRSLESIAESQSEIPEGCDFAIDFAFEDDPSVVKTIWYLKDNAGRYLITEA